MHSIPHSSGDEFPQDDIGFHHLEKVFKDHHRSSTHKLLTTHPVVEGLLREPVHLKELEAESAKILTAGAITTAMFITPISAMVPNPLLEGAMNQELQSDSSLIQSNVDSATQNKVLAILMRPYLPSRTQRLSDTQSDAISRIVMQRLGIQAQSGMDGYRLSTDYGITGYEQHLMRYSGDTVSQHDAFREDGIAPKKGAWGYFANSKEQMTEDDYAKEKYYFAVQTFYSPSWSENMYATKDWFEHRKMIMINTNTGEAVVGVVADAGPAAWTGKQFGASPEIMHELSLGGDMRKGEVVMMFVVDPEDTIPLGPVN